jgi:hypothetical protein
VKVVWPLQRQLEGPGGGGQEGGGGTRHENFGTASAQRDALLQPRLSCPFRHDIASATFPILCTHLDAIPHYRSLHAQNLSARRLRKYGDRPPPHYFLPHWLNVEPEIGAGISFCYVGRPVPVYMTSKHS